MLLLSYLLREIESTVRVHTSSSPDGEDGNGDVIEFRVPRETPGPNHQCPFEEMSTNENPYVPGSNALGTGPGVFLRVTFGPDGSGDSMPSESLTREQNPQDSLTHLKKD